MNSLVLGQGQIGEAVTENINRTDKVYIFDKKGGEPPILAGIDIIHICFPCKNPDKFIKNVNEYIRKYKAIHVIIWSTVPIGTTKKIRGAVHSPVEGRHPKLAPSIKQMTRWLGANDKVEGEFFEDYFAKLNIKTRIVRDSNFTEFLKLRSTSKYGINLVWTQYEADVSDELNMDMELLRDFDRDYNRLYQRLGMDWAQRYILGSPHGAIGGHCIVPNAEILDEQYPSELLKMIKAFK